MIKRYLLTFLAFSLLVIGYLLTLLPLQTVRSDLATGTYIKALLIWGVLVALSFVPAVSRTIKKIWVFPGSGEPVPEKDLRAVLLAINTMNVPIRVTEKRKRMLVGWRYDDPQWCERMVAAGLSRIYELRLKFNAKTRTVTVVDRYRRVNFDLCPVRVKTGILALPRPLFLLKKGRGISTYRQMNPADFHFKPTEIKAPLTATILAHGWNVQFALF